VNIAGAIGRRSHLFVSLFTLVLFGLAMASRYLVPPRFSVAFIFLLPISFATWFISWAAGCVIAAAGVVFLLYFELMFTNGGAAAAYWNGLINLLLAATFIYIFAELRALYLKQIDLSRRDSLTGLLNRRAFMEMLAIENHRMARHHRPLTISYVDVDNFKHINDRYGHAAGDKFLVCLGHHMGNRLRATDYLARVGGDEFAILLPETDQAGARLVLGAVTQAVRRFTAANEHSATVSVGAVTFMSASSAETMIAMADQAMYKVKQNGKNNVEYKLTG
jgi:diguanylate cyclase (GGDEF)-like protein